MKDRLYHFFPRKFESAKKTLSISESILENGLYLSKEILKVDWKDRYAIGGLQRDLTAEQMRFCLTAITNEAELNTHACRFGCIGLEFDLELIVKMGGFPIFYVPTPKSEHADIEEYTGISLLYRLADFQEILEYIVEKNIILTDDIDIKNVLGAIKFLANICYPTQRKPNSSAGEVSYYSQREWRIIKDLTSEKVRIGQHLNNITIEAFNNKPIREFITQIVIIKHELISDETCYSIFRGLSELIARFGLNCALTLNDLKSK